MYKIFLLTFLLIAFNLLSAQVTVSINSGNPKYPFPQFLAYEYAGGHSLGNLATKNAPGVPHAELEQRTRDAWQIFANSFTYSGETWGGVKYIKGNIGCPYDCSEGDGYALLAAAYMGDKTVFDGLWMRTHDVRRALKKHTIPAQRLEQAMPMEIMHWQNLVATQLLMVTWI